jgi:hypothetical protein
MSAIALFRRRPVAKFVCFELQRLHSQQRDHPTYAVRALPANRHAERNWVDGTRNSEAGRAVYRGRAGVWAYDQSRRNAKSNDRVIAQRLRCCDCFDMVSFEEDLS